MLVKRRVTCSHFSSDIIRRGWPTFPASKGFPCLDKLILNNRFLAECSDKRLSTQYLRPNIQPIYHRCKMNAGVHTGVHAAHLTEKFGRCLPTIRSSKARKVTTFCSIFVLYTCHTVGLKKLSAALQSTGKQEPST